MFKSKTDIEQIRKQLRKLSKAEREELALDMLGEDAKAWWDHRARTNRLILPNGNWVSQFNAAGETYYILRADELSELRYTKLRDFESVVGNDSTIADQIMQANRMSALFNTLLTDKPKLHELGVEIANRQQALAERTKRNWDYSLMAATLVICRKGSDKTKWDEREAEQDIENWNKAGFPAHDFFLLVMYF